MKPNVLKKIHTTNQFMDFVRIGALALIISVLMIAAANAISALKEALVS